jgi:hypothetical protein
VPFSIFFQVNSILLLSIIKLSSNDIDFSSSPLYSIFELFTIIFNFETGVVSIICPLELYLTFKDLKSLFGVIVVLWLISTLPFLLEIVNPELSGVIIIPDFELNAWSSRIIYWESVFTNTASAVVWGTII